MGRENSGIGQVARIGLGRVTIADLAMALDLSKGTVSRALNEYDDISEATKMRVAEAARRMGYRPLEHAQAIRTGRIKSIGLILQMDEHDGYGPFLRDYLAGISQSASDLGWSLTVASAKSSADFERTARRMVEQRRVDGFILPRTLVNDTRFNLLQRMDVPSVLFGRVGYGTGTVDAGASWYDIDGEAALAEAVNRLVKFGHCRIGFVGAPAEYNYSHIRRDGYLRGLAEAGLEHDPDLMISDVRTFSDGERAARKLLLLAEPPTAIVYSTDETALGAYDAAAGFGLKLGRDLSIISYDGAARGSYMQPTLTTFRVNLSEAGYRLASLLVRRVEGEAPESLREMAKAQLVRGGTDGPAVLTSLQLATRICRTAA
ncbi:MAG: substrate-binding domain-containing protein [Rhodobacteraceae bacterium]|nr:substrate-binding domain-containing protein [Paracoccaceae bacterium]